MLLFPPIISKYYTLNRVQVAVRFRSPIYPGLHWHWKSPVPSTHRPPFWQGAESHSSTSISHFAPENREPRQRQIWSPDTDAAAIRRALHWDHGMERNSVLLMWNKSCGYGSPEKPGMQVQMYPAPTSSHVPLFWQGFRKHSWKTCRKCKSELSVSGTETERRSTFRFISELFILFKCIRY